MAFFGSLCCLSIFNKETTTWQRWAAFQANRPPLPTVGGQQKAQGGKKNKEAEAQVSPEEHARRTAEREIAVKAQQAVHGGAQRFLAVLEKSADMFLDFWQGDEIELQVVETNAPVAGMYGLLSSMWNNKKGERPDWRGFSTHMRRMTWSISSVRNDLTED